MSWLTWVFHMLVGKLLKPKCSWARVEAEVAYAESCAAKDHQILDEPDPNQFAYDA